MAATVSLTLDTRRVKQRTGKYPLKLVVTFQRKGRRYQTFFEFTPEEYKKLSSPRVTGELLEKREELKKMQRSAEEAVHAIDPFTFPDFERAFIWNNRLFHQRKGIRDSIPKSEYLFDRSQYAHRFPIFKEPVSEPGTLLYTTLSYVDRLLQEHRTGSAVSYQTMYYALKKFRGNVRLVEANVAWLTQYEAWMLAQEYSKTTIGIYLRSLRAIFNEAIEEGLIRREKHYPFGRRKYQIPTGRNVKKALNLEDVARIYHYIPEDVREERARDFWLFSYLANWMNPKDMAFLKFKNIVGEFLVFERAKTEKATRYDPKPISVYLTEEMRQIMKRWGNKEGEPNDYIFPVLTPGITPIRQYELVEIFIRSVNDWMAVVRKKLGIGKHLTTYVARHTFSTVLKRSGVSTEFIQEALGHTSIRTTENYLDSFEKEVKKEYAGRLLDFKKGE